MADFLDLEPSPDKRDDIVGRHARRFIDEENAVRSGSQ